MSANTERKRQPVVVHVTYTPRGEIEVKHEEVVVYHDRIGSVTNRMVELEEQQVLKAKDVRVKD